MSTDLDTTRIVRSWLEEGRTTLPDWVRDDVMDRLPSTPQRRSRWTAWRFTTMPTAAKTAIAAAAVIAVAVGALAFLQRPTGPSATPTPSPTTAPTPTESVEPSAAIVFVPGSGPIAAGTYRMGGEASIRLTIPPGWDAAAGDESPTGTDIRKHRDEPGELTFWVDASDNIRVYADTCATDATPPRTGPTADDLLTALRAQENSDVSEPVEVTIGGRDVMRFDISIPESLDEDACTNGFARVWQSITYGWLVPPSPAAATVHVAETPAGRIVFGFSAADDVSATDFAELEAMVDSMVIEP